MRNKVVNLAICSLLSLGVQKPLFAANVTWNGLNSSSDLNTNGNWLPTNVPTSGDVAAFDSTVANINTTPTDANNFNVSSIDFLNSADSFTFTFDQNNLTLGGAGITGSQTNTTINVNNTNNSTQLATDQVTLSGLTSTTGSAALNISNLGTLSGPVSSMTLNQINNDQLNATNAYSISSNGSLTLTNTANDSTAANGGNSTGVILNQMAFNSSTTGGDALTLGDHVTIIGNNSGTFTGTNITTGNNVGIISMNQLLVGDALQAGDFLTINLSNTGSEDSSNTSGQNNTGNIDLGQMVVNGNFNAGANANLTLQNQGTISSLSAGYSNSGYILANQLSVGGNFQTGDSFTLNVSNAGTGSGNGTSDQIGYIVNSLANFSGPVTVGNQSQLIITNQGTVSGTVNSFSTGFANNGLLDLGGAFQAGDDLTINLTNKGYDSSTGIGSNSTGVSNGVQFLADYPVNVGNNASIVVKNEGTNSASGISGSSIGVLDNSMIIIGDTFTAGDYLNLNFINSGNDTSTGGAFNVVGFCRYHQSTFGNFSAGDHATITISNSGTFSGTSNNETVATVSLGNSGFMQLLVQGIFQAGDYFTLNVTNSGNDSDTGAGSNQVGTLGDSQVTFYNNLSLGDHARISLSNSGIGSGLGTFGGSQIGTTGNPQFTINGNLTAGDDFYIIATNSGENHVSGNGNIIGFVDDPQIEFSADSNFGNDAVIIASNFGNIDSGAFGCLTGSTSAEQFAPSTFVAGDNLSITLTNLGMDSSTGDGNSTANIQYNQMSIYNSLTAGDNASISISNSGICTTTGDSSTVAFIEGDQFAVLGPFATGSDLSINVSNAAQNTSASLVGAVNSQINFQNTVTIGNGAQIIASNLGSGKVNGSQIIFQNGFDLTGKATFQATTQGSVTGSGILIGAGSGGDVNIILGNSSLNIQSPSSTFTIGQLNGDSTSIAQSLPVLTIATDATVNATFTGTIQNYPAMVSSLVKTGVGIQNLSGINTFTGLTQVEEGTLVLNGSLAGAVDIISPGILKGIGTVYGNVTNSGIISPGQSIGTIHFLSNFTNNNGGYDVEVNGAGLSDLINVTGTTQLNGGRVLVSSTDGTYKFRSKYTIVSAGQVNGTYSSVSTLSSLIVPQLSYDSQHVYLTLLTDFASAAATHNQQVVALQLDGIRDPNAAQNLLFNELVGQSTMGVRNSLNSLSGFQHTVDIFTTQSINRQFIRRLYDPIRTIVTTEPNCFCLPCNDFQAWFEAGGTFIQADGIKGVNGFYSNGYEVTGGVQKTFLTNLTLGVAGSYEHDDLQFRHGGVGQEKSDTWFVGLYGLYRPSCFYGLVDFAYGDSSHRLDRSIDVGSLHYQATSKPKSYQFTFYGEAGVDLNLLKFLIQPFFGIEAGSYHRNHLQESSSSGLGLDVQKRDRSLASTRLGLHLTTDGIWQNWVTVSVDAAWNRLLTKHVNHIDEGFSDFGTPFAIYGQNFNRDSIDYALTFTAPVSRHFTGYIEASGESWSRYNVFNILGGIEYNW